MHFQILLQIYFDSHQLQAAHADEEHCVVIDFGSCARHQLVFSVLSTHSRIIDVVFAQLASVLVNGEHHIHKLTEENRSYNLVILSIVPIKIILVNDNEIAIHDEGAE